MDGFEPEWIKSIELEVKGNLSMSHVLCFIIDIIIILSHILLLIIIFVIIVLIIAMIINNAIILIITLIEKGIIFYFIIIINLLWSKWNQVKRNVTLSESSLTSFCLLLKWSCLCLICKFNNWLHHFHVSIKLISWVHHLLKFKPDSLD